MNEKIEALRKQVEEAREKEEHQPKYFHSELEAYAYLQKGLNEISNIMEKCEKSLDLMYDRACVGLFSGSTLDTLRVSLMIMYSEVIDMYTDVIKAIESEENYG